MLDIYQRESEAFQQRQPKAPAYEPGVWDGFVRSTGISTMRGLAQMARSVDLLGAVGPIIQDAITGGTQAQDKYFKEHDEIFNRAVDYWTPNRRETGAAGEIAGTLLSTLPFVIAAPSLAVGSMQLSVAEDLVRQGVDAKTANLVGASQAAGLGLGIYVPIFGRTLLQRILYGGVGFNVAQGAAMRASAEALLQGTPAEGSFKTLDKTELTLDVLMGAAFGGIAHLSPAQRRQSAAVWNKIEEVARQWNGRDLDALTTLRQAKHKGLDSMPAKPVSPVDIERHTTRVERALDQLMADQRVAVDDLPAPNLEVDPARMKQAAKRIKELGQLAEAVRKDEGIDRPPPPIQIDYGEGLNDAQKKVELKARSQVENNLDGQVEAYKKLKSPEDTQGGKILNTDTARELFPDYRKNRAENAASVHEPASALIKHIYARALQEADPNNINLVTFTAGGTGAGKTSSYKAVPLANDIVKASQIVYDTNMNGFRSATKKVDQAIAAGKRVAIIYVGADPVDAFRRALERASRMEQKHGSGRALPIVEHIKTHSGAADTLLQMQEAYRGNDKVQFVVLDNTNPEKGNVRIIEPDQAPEYVKQFDFNDLEPKLLGALEDEFKKGRISESVYRGTKGSLSGGVPESARGKGQAEPAGRAGPGGEGKPATAEGQGRVTGPEAPATKPGEAVSSPPRGEPGVGAGAEGTVGPLQFEAERFVAEHPDLQLRVGQTADGEPIMRSAREFLEDAQRAAQDVQDDIPLFEAAAACLLGRGA